MNEEVNLESVMRRVQKLLAIANDDRANPNEAAAAAQQAEKIMRKYQIDNADVIAKDLRGGKADMKFEMCSCIMKRDLAGTNGAHVPVKVPPWGQWLAVPIARLNDCEVRLAVSPKFGACVAFFGYGPDVDVCKYTFDYLVGCMISSVRAYQKAATRSKVESESFRRGFCLSVAGRLQDQKAERDREMAAAVSSRALVVSKRQAIEEAFGEFRYSQAKKAKINYSSSAYSEGREAGKAVDINRRGITHAGTAASPLLN